ncbi:hypothetical protein CDD82_793 [Ophiocordyceps australis]|uniref:Uncharacterized protein n=1 Tax=Ophiocordyceps australis TaxID=1399860 RepID=A0A2C5YKD4_9HYPO|nr:hypothetical protein CDD82_793 [Ophiocordyceps australis]
MSKPLVPDAWDDDWEAQADQAQPSSLDAASSSAPLSKAERLTQHAEANRKIWESADSPQTFHYLEASNKVPLTWAFTPQVKVLSRKPVAAKRDGATGKTGLALDKDDDEDDGAAANAQPSVEEIRARQKREREEKQRRYDEARAKIFGESQSSSRGSSPGIVTPPRADSRLSSWSQGRGRGRSAAHKTPLDNRPQQQQPDPRRQNKHLGDESYSRSSNQHPHAMGAQTRELYDPNSHSRPDANAANARRGATESPLRSEPIQPIRAPRGPDGSGRGGCGFTRRGA